MAAIFFKLLDAEDKNQALLIEINKFKTGVHSERRFVVDPSEFEELPGKALSYWLSSESRSLFTKLPRLGSGSRALKQGLATADDGRFIRCWWEVDGTESGGSYEKWVPFIKGVDNQVAYSETKLFVNWQRSGAEIKNNLNAKGIPRSNVWMLGETEVKYFLRPGLAWPSRPNVRGRFSIVPAGCIFSHTSTMLFSASHDLWSLCGVVNSAPYSYLLHSLMPRGVGDTGATLQYEVGYVASVPIPEVHQNSDLAASTTLAWRLGYQQASIDETSHAFLLPEILRPRLGKFTTLAIESGLARTQAEIDAIAFDLYGFTQADRLAAQGLNSSEINNTIAVITVDETSEEEAEPTAQPLNALLSWALGVAFGRFDWRLANAERLPPPEPDPFDPLPSKSPGMLPDGDVPFYAHFGILVDDPGHRYDLVRLVEEVLVRVDLTAQENVRRWLQRDFFSFHLQRYSKSRRKSPIYWPLSTPSGSYTIWVYYPSFTSQTLYTIVNDFIEPKLKQVGADVAALRNKSSARNRDDEKQFEAQLAFEQELTDFRDTLIKITTTYLPNHDDGVQITAAPLWQLFRHKPWQKVLKDTWTKLEKGDYDWAHLAMAYWPERVREKCKTDKSLAIAHGLEDLYAEPEATPKKTRGKKKQVGGEE
jgi:hypothetical protein